MSLGASTESGARRADRLVRLVRLDEHGQSIVQVSPAPDAQRPNIRWSDGLTIGSAPALCGAVTAALDDGAQQLMLDLTAVAVTDVVGLAAVLQSARVAAGRGCDLSVVVNRRVHAAMLNGQLLDEVKVSGELVEDPLVDHALTESQRLRESPLLARAERLGLRQPTWDELALFEQWGKEPLLDQMVGSQLLYLCRHLGPYHPDFASLVWNDPTSLTLLIQPLTGDAPIGFVRFYATHLVEQFTFLETAVADLRGLRKGWGVEASRLLLAFGMDALGIRRVEAKVYAYNHLSINALKRNGFRQEGVLRQARTYDGQRWDILVFSILEEEMVAERAAERFPYMGFWRDAPDCLPTSLPLPRGEGRGEGRR
jgi:RimJ/RimL family protein N-acetyltransferase